MDRIITLNLMNIRAYDCLNQIRLLLKNILIDWHRKNLKIMKTKMSERHIKIKAIR